MFHFNFRLLAALTLCVSAALAAPIRVSVTNLAPAGGTFLTPVWAGFHNGSFVVYTLGQAASPELERVAEDGDTGAITAAFTASGTGSAQATLGGAPIAPGSTVSFLFDLDPLNAQNRYFSFVSMVIPSNDAFIGNGNPTQFQIFDALGNFTAVSQIVMGTMVRDAGTEVNDEIPMNTAFFGQAAPNVGTAENGVVGVHPGFIPGGAILSDPMFANANFLASGYQVARLDIEAVPEPASLGLMLLGGAGLWLRSRKKTA